MGRRMAPRLSTSNGSGVGPGPPAGDAASRAHGASRASRCGSRPRRDGVASGPPSPGRAVASPDLAGARPAAVTSEGMAPHAHDHQRSRSLSHARLRRCIEAVEHDDDRCTERAPSASTVSRTALIVPSPASATSTTRSGSSAPHSARQSPSAASGERTPPAVSTRPTLDRVVRPAQLAHQVGDRERGSSQRLGRHRGRHRHLVPAVRRAHHLGWLPARGAEDGGVASRRVVVGLEGLRRLAGRHRHTGRPQVGQEAGGDPRLADVGAGADDHDQRGDERRGPDSVDAATGLRG